MKLAFFVVKKAYLRRVLSIFLVSVSLLLVNFFSYGIHSQALAEDAEKVPSYQNQLNLTAENIKSHTENSSGEYLGDNAQYQIGKAIDTVRGKINTDEPLPQKAKKLVDLASEKANEALNQTPN